MRFYLANPFNSKEETREWEELVESKTNNIHLINPFYDVERDDKEGFTFSTGFGEWDSKQIVERDIETIRTSDGVIAIVNDSLSYGTIMEIVYGYILGKSVYTVISNGHIDHPWFIYHSTQRFETLQELEDFLVELDSKMESSIE